MEIEYEEQFFKNYKGIVRLNVPVSLFQNKNIKALDIMLYEIIDHLSYKKGYCWASNKTLANLLHVSSNKTIQTSINKLVNLNYIKKNNVLYNGIIRRRLYTIDNAAQVILEERRNSLSEEDLKALDYDWLIESE